MEWVENTSQEEDFEAAKATQGSHFQFKLEKEWQSSNIPVTSIFRVNMKTLAEDLSTIPFYERQQLPKELFSEQELTAMDKEAQMCSERQNYTKSKSELVPAVTEINREQPPCVSSSVVHIQRDIQSVVHIQRDIQSLEIEESPKNTDDLEDWLDSVLDD